MVRILRTHQLLLMQYPYLVVGAGFDVPTGVPRALKKSSAPLWWQGEGEGTAFRLAPSPDTQARYAVSLWWAHRSADVPDFQEQPFATGRNTVHLEAPSEGTFAISGTHADGVPVTIQFDSPVVSYSWTIYTKRGLTGEGSEGGQAPQLETLTLVFD